VNGESEQVYSIAAVLHVACKRWNVSDVDTLREYLSIMDHVLNRGPGRCMWKVDRQPTLCSDTNVYAVTTVTQ